MIGSTDDDVYEGDSSELLTTTALVPGEPAELESIGMIAASQISYVSFYVPIEIVFGAIVFALLLYQRRYVSIHSSPSGPMSNSMVSETSK